MPPCHSRVIACSVYAMAGDHDKCIKHGMTDYMTKPMSKHGLHKMMARYHTRPASTGDSTCVSPRDSPSMPQVAIHGQRLSNSGPATPTCSKKLHTGRGEESDVGVQLQPQLQALLTTLQSAVKKKDVLALRQAADAALVAAGYMNAKALQNVLGELLLIEASDEHLPLLIDQIDAELTKLLQPNALRVIVTLNWLCDCYMIAM